MRKKCLSAIFVETNICGTLQNYTVKIIGELAMSNVCNVFSKCVNVRWATEKRQKKKKTAQFWPICTSNCTLLLPSLYH